MNGFDFPVEVIRTNRKRSVSIQLKPEGVRILAPKSISDKRIREIITQKTPWITRKQQEVALAPTIKPKTYSDGESFSYLGQDYQLKITAGDTPSLQLQGSVLAATLPQPSTQTAVKSLVLSWYQEQAAQCLTEKTGQYAELIGVKPKSIRLKDYKSRWGSCSINGDISYSWRIILAPHPIVDYVVVHELCHMLEHNHSKRYWQHVARHLPDYKEHRKWLRINGTSAFML